MSTVVALGEARALDGFALVGVTVVHASTADEQRTAWRRLDGEVGLVILTRAALEAIGDELVDRSDVLAAVMP